MSTTGSEKTATPAISRVPAARIEFLPADRAWIAERIQEVLATGQLTLGKYGAEFEVKFSQLCGLPHGISVNSGTSALEIILRSLGVEGREVIIPTNTFFATAAAIIHAGGTPVFADIEPEHFSVDIDTLEPLFTAKTAGIIAVHIGGIVSSQMPSLADLARKKGLWLVEDAAHAHGSSYQGVSAGAFGIAGAFSFYPTKVMTSGEGGMVVTGDKRIAEEARIYRDQGKASFTQNAHVRMGYNWRMSEPHAIIGLRHLERLPAMVSDRQAVAACYDTALQGFQNLKPLRVPAGGVCNYYKYIALLKGRTDRSALKALLRERYAISLSGEVYEEPLHMQPVFKMYASHALPVAEDLCARHICLPVYSGMSTAEVRQVVSALEQVLG
jgi:dTDP-4-amino-4,6-dideoxygalactose transaminase